MVSGYGRGCLRHEGLSRDRSSPPSGPALNIRTCGSTNETGKPGTDRTAGVSEQVSATERTFSYYGPHASGGSRRTTHPGLRRSGGGQETGQPLSASGHHLGSVPAPPAVLPTPTGSLAGHLPRRDR